MAKQIVWTKRASEKFADIISYLESDWGYQVTLNFIRRSFELIELISNFPDIGTLENPQKDIRGFLITSHNKLFYRISSKKIILLNFFDTRSNPKK